MNLPNKEPRTFSGNGSFRPLRRVWVFTWVMLCVIGAVKLLIDFLGL